MDNLGHPIPDAVHLPHPLHLVFCLELFCDAFGGCILLRQQGKHLLDLPVEFRQIRRQPAGGQEVYITNPPVLAQVSQMPLALGTDDDFFSVYSQIGKSILSDHRIAAAQFLINGLLHM